MFDNDYILFTEDEAMSIFEEIEIHKQEIFSHVPSYIHKKVITN